jgi:hypothetical protein
MESEYHARIHGDCSQRSASFLTRIQLVLAATLAALCLASWLTPLALAAESTGQITGKVTDVATEAPIAGIEVCVLTKSGEPGENGEETFSASTGQCEKTGANGEYTLSGLTSGSYVVGFGPPFASELNYVNQFYNDKASPSEASPVTVTEGSTMSGIDAKLGEGGRIAGKVTDASNGSALGGVFVCAFEANPEIGRCTSSNSGGEYTISGLAGGEYKVQFFRSEYVGQYYNDKPSLAEATPVSVLVGSTASGIDTALQPKTPEPPKDITPPKVIPEAPSEGGGSETPTAASTLLCFRGLWSGTPKPTYTYKWLRDGIPIVGMAESKYVVQAADAGHTLACEVTAKNSQGEKSATSAGVMISGGAGGSGTSNTAGSGAGVTIASTKLVVSRRGLVRIKIRCGDAPCRGSVELTAHFLGRRRKSKTRVLGGETVVLAKGTFSLAGGKNATVTLRLTAAGRRRVAHAKRHPLTAQLVVSLVGGKASTEWVKVS